MSKNNDRYKEDYISVDIEELDEIETKRFEKFRPKKKEKAKAKHKSDTRQQEDES
jgi:hypothetical protein